MSTEYFAPVHPGEILKEEYLKELGISQNQLARDLRVPAQRINQIIQCKRSITVDTALRLARYFNTTPKFWLNLQDMYDLDKAVETRLTEKIEKEVVPRKELMAYA